MMTVKTQNGYYQVIVASKKKGLESFFITKVDGKVECTCGEKKCPHRDAVMAYIATGGARPSKADYKEAERKRLERCPVCEGPLISDRGTTWHCGDGGSAHFFQWLDDYHKGAVKKWMCGAGREAWREIIGDDSVSGGRRDNIQGKEREVPV